jgi:hypothetical protein
VYGPYKISYLENLRLLTYTVKIILSNKTAGIVKKNTLLSEKILYVVLLSILFLEYSSWDE